MSFLSNNIMRGTDWRALERAVARLMMLAGWENVAVVGESGDEGADIIGVRYNHGVPQKWVVQVKSVIRGKYVGVSAINEVMHAMSLYGAQVAAVATNGDFYSSAIKKKTELCLNGFDLKLWNGSFLSSLFEKLPDHSRQKGLRKYQDEIVQKMKTIYSQKGRRAFYVVATGLGKTVIAARIARYLWEEGNHRILVLCHAQDLALQLEQSFWSELSKEIPTRVFFGGFPPLLYDGINFGLYQTFQSYLSGISESDFDVVIVDEAHHALASGFRTCLEHLHPRFLIGMTATPWRGDGQSVIEIFGEPIKTVSLIDGMSQGYLSQVDYRLFCDNIDWHEVPNLSKSNLSIRDLNKKLFLPQRDDAIIAEIKKVSKEVGNPRIIVFSPSVEHGKLFSQKLSVEGITSVPLSGLEKIERRKNLLDFTAGKFTAVTAVDLLNEGIDVPDVNILVFLRATHSRRIFVQQLGRGLRLAEGKKKVIVLDFVSDVRRIADVVRMDNEGRVKGKETETVYLQNGFVKFNDIKAQEFMMAWLADVADIGDCDDNEKLSFPEVL